MELTKEQLQKHGEVILAWANGAEVEVKGHISGKWRGIDRPAFDTQYEHRVKPAPTYQERQAQWVKETGIKVGDTVWIVRGFENEEGGCDVSMNREGEMDNLVGTIGVVADIYSYKINVKSGARVWSWPYFCLEPVKEPTYRPYTFEEAREHLWGEKIVRKSDGFLAIADRVDKTGTGSYSPEWYFSDYAYLDGSPCGMQETPQES